ncbi:UDP-N-acetylmuramoyl-L-alanine--D-glutamate ligase [Clostridium sp. Marseille-P299]|uniref:UDP-N-acetylmuramoyl-L-alanine--D-glutamate ligase n=1 Tax=Clostridium sp. Marseille-P299 TaxID=1805477 RepID=UPI0008343F17|nr:UDP-N-acetylmuramoyl-L-alanine--D-glutamate ligase [Clostridium sp. Marseille-P299]
MELEGVNILVVGTGISGISAVNLLISERANIILYDSKEGQGEAALREKLPKEFNGQIILGELPKEVMKTIELVVLSPGVPTDLDYINELRENGVPIWGEIELGYQFSKGKIVAITGTNGKTTTTTLVGEIMKTYFEDVFVVGNIGIPYTSMVKKTTKDSVTVAEMSSFQLETIHNFVPNVSAILNITPDHLDRHHTMEAYINAKANIMMNQGENETCVLNYEDKELRKIGELAKANILWFSSQRKLEKGIYLLNDNIIYKNDNSETTVCNIHDLKIFGRHNYENVMAAVGMSIAMGIPMSFIYKALVEFKGVEHRIEYVATKQGVQYYNDSKGTNPDASIQAVKAMRTKTLLIGGGYDKDSEYDEWIRAFDGKVKYLVLMGQTKEKIANTARKLGFHDIIMVESMKEAVEFCAIHANAGESVLLSPCCASWGMFKNYEERGNMFKEYVHALKD